MTSIILINATLGVAVLVAIVTAVVWAIRTQHRDLPGAVATVRPSRQVTTHRGPARRPEFARQLG